MLRKLAKLKTIANNINHQNNNVLSNILANHQLKSCSDLFFMIFFGKKVNANIYSILLKIQIKKPDIESGFIFLVKIIF